VDPERRPTHGAAGVKLPWWEYDDLVVLPTIGACAVCHTDTRFAELNFQCRMHPGECTDKMWIEYNRANTEAGPIDWP
jgi:hypothetical protein